MNIDIKKLRTIDIDRDKLKRLRGSVDRAVIADSIGVKANQIANIENGIRYPSAKGLLRLMLLYNIKPEDLIKTA